MDILQTVRLKTPEHMHINQRMLERMQSIINGFNKIDSKGMYAPILFHFSNDEIDAQCGTLDVESCVFNFNELDDREVLKSIISESDIIEISTTRNDCVRFSFDFPKLYEFDNDYAKIISIGSYRKVKDALSSAFETYLDN